MGDNSDGVPVMQYEQNLARLQAIKRRKRTQVTQLPTTLKEAASTLDSSGGDDDPANTPRTLEGKQVRKKSTRVRVNELTRKPKLKTSKYQSRTVPAMVSVSQGSIAQSFDDFRRTFNDPAHAESSTTKKRPQDDGPVVQYANSEDAQFVEDILKRPPYWESLANYKVHEGFKLPELPEVDAQQVAAFLYAPTGTMRPCVFGGRCNARKIPHSRGPVVLREWLSPKEWKRYQKTGTLPSERNLCIVCVHYLVNKVWQRNKNNDHRAVDSDTGISRVAHPHYYRVDVPGQYRRACMIHPTPGYTEGIIRPFRLHDLSDYLEDTSVPSGDPPGFVERQEIFFR